ncbi:aldehyde dehydrogenase [Aureobasidium sp. EXF-12298]|nr:aldehyde dehydrogenase [Aureobasidium sp. EXF-12298]
MDTKLPVFEHTAIEQIRGIHARVYDSFHSQKTKPLSWRVTQLRKLWWAIKDREQQLGEALQRDLGRPFYEAYLTEIGWVLNDIIFTINNLEKWAKEEPAGDVPLTFMAMRPRVRKEPLGVVVILGAFNFPVQLSLGPLIGAIAAGCTAVLKPSESSPCTAALLQEIMEASLDPSAFICVQGAIPESSALLELKWDKIFYTGSATVGTIIAKKGAETLTPVTLELGGRNPAIITKNADPRLAARRLLWAKIHNAGQVCVSQNYILVDKEVLPFLLKELKTAIKEFYPEGTKASKDYGRIVNSRQFERLKKMLDSSKGEILFGGEMDAETNYIAPTIVRVSSTSDSLVVDESFGPFIPLLPVDNLDEAIRIANEVHSTPLGLYAFGSKADTTRILSETRSGGASINDGFTHASMPTIEFGGVGDTGAGCYRGKASFDCFTHRRVVTNTPAWVESLLSARYPPYKGKLSQLKMINDFAPNFDREGKLVTFGLIGRLLALGGATLGQGIKRWLVLVVLALGVKYGQMLGLQERLKRT